MLGEHNPTAYTYKPLQNTVLPYRVDLQFSPSLQHLDSHILILQRLSVLEAIKMTSLYDLSVPVYIRSLENLINVLKKGEKWADENKVPHEKLVIHFNMTVSLRTWG